MYYEFFLDGYIRYRNLDADLRVRDRIFLYFLYLDRDRIFLEGDWISFSKSFDRRNSLEGYSRLVRSRSGERWGGDGDRVLFKFWEERRKRRSFFSDRGRIIYFFYEERIRIKGGG